MFLKLFARDLEYERNRADFLDAQLAKAEERIKLLESALRSETKAHNLALRRAADANYRQQKLPASFVKDVEEKKDEPEILYTQDDLEKFDYFARQMRDADVDVADGDESKVAPLTDYIERIKADPDRVFV